ncbi:hypothetical protein XENTR_v10014570 [Xenopus tropicalis]|nr:hypothetical protein XENTR_v10014570 [Xenopus tropicalis]KAE8604094.1 hypothetical protein XENTR_v10014570 [Xenopus tropicalis]
MQSILYDDIELPEYLSEDASAFIKDLLEKDPEYRLGSGEAGAEMVKEHPFFRVGFYSIYFDLQTKKALMNIARASKCIITFFPAILVFGPDTYYEISPFFLSGYGLGPSIKPKNKASI